MDKTYSTAANARRAARTAGMAEGSYSVDQNADGRWVYNVLEQNAPRNRSTVDKPVQVVWDIVDNNPDDTRKVQVGKAVAAGVNYYTARTQVQLARRAQRDQLVGAGA